nr:histone-like nucleoid-structuring protein Lsr2 [Rhodococcus sp. Leaf278]
MGAAGQATRTVEQGRAIRQWASDQGYEIRERGRIPADRRQKVVRPRSLATSCSGS